MLFHKLSLVNNIHLADQRLILNKVILKRQSIDIVVIIEILLILLIFLTPTTFFLAVYGMFIAISLIHHFLLL